VWGSYLVLFLDSPVLNFLSYETVARTGVEKKKIVECIFLRDRYFSSNLQETSRRAKILIGSDRSESAG